MDRSLEPLMILVAGPYRSGTGDDPGRMAENLRAMEALALPLFRAGHIPLIGEWLALPLVVLAGSRRVGGVYFGRDEWPHGRTGPAVPHGAMFARP